MRILQIGKMKKGCGDFTAKLICTVFGRTKSLLATSCGGHFCYVFIGHEMIAFIEHKKGDEKKMPKTKLSRVDVRMTPEEKENLKNRADKAHMSVSKYIVYLSETKRVILKDDIVNLTVEISRIGRNINEIAYIGNYQKYFCKAQLEVLSEYLQQIIELQKKILCAMFSEEDYSLISIEKKIEYLTKSFDNILSKRTDS